MSKIYLIGTETEGLYKIGLTTGDVGKRLKKLQTGNDEELYICRFFETDAPYVLEGMLHRHFFNKKKLNEWFELSNEDVLSFIDVCEKYQETINFMNKHNEFFKKY
jgi:hypothetical protein